MPMEISIGGRERRIYEGLASGPPVCLRVPSLRPEPSLYHRKPDVPGLLRVWEKAQLLVGAHAFQVAECLFGQKRPDFYLIQF